MENEQKCVLCGCTEYDACIHAQHGACWWVKPGLCSHCAYYPGQSHRVDEVTHKAIQPLASYRLDIKVYRNFPPDSECDAVLLYIKKGSREGAYSSLIAHTTPEEKDQFLTLAHEYEEYFKIIGVTKV